MFPVTCVLCSVWVRPAIGSEQQRKLIMRATSWQGKSRKERQHTAARETSPYNAAMENKQTYIVDLSVHQM